MKYQRNNFKENLESTQWRTILSVKKKGSGRAIWNCREIMSLEIWRVWSKGEVKKGSERGIWRVLSGERDSVKKGNDIGIWSILSGTGDSLVNKGDGRAIWSVSGKTWRVVRSGGKVVKESGRAIWSINKVMLKKS